jgi:hypothetical protein
MIKFTPMKKRLFNKAVKYFGSQTKFADYFGYSRQFITNVKRGAVGFPKKSMKELLIILGDNNEQSS